MALLDSYQTERDPNARAFVEISVARGQVINQTSAGNIPHDRKQSIWPNLDPWLGPRDGFGGVLAPQVRTDDGPLADDVAEHNFHVLAQETIAMHSNRRALTNSSLWSARQHRPDRLIRNWHQSPHNRLIVAHEVSYPRDCLYPAGLSAPISQKVRYGHT